MSKGTCRMSLGVGFLTQLHRENTPGLRGAAGQGWWEKPGMQCESQVIYCLSKSRKSSVELEIKSLFYVYQVKHFW